MAKKQTFGDKVGKNKASGKSHVKLIRAGRSAKSGALRFYEEIVKISDDKNADTAVKDILSSK